MVQPFFVEDLTAFIGNFPKFHEIVLKFLSDMPLEAER